MITHPPSPQPARGSHPCLREREAVQRCIKQRLASKCQPILDAFNTCEEKYFTKTKVDAIHDNVK